VHIEFVYGRFSILPHRSQSIAGASRGLLFIFVSMLALSLARTFIKQRREKSVVRTELVKPALLPRRLK